MDKVIVVGASGHAKLIIDILELNGQTQIVGLVDSFRPIGYSMMNYTVLGTEGIYPRWWKAIGLMGWWLLLVITLFVFAW